VCEQHTRTQVLVVGSTAGETSATPGEGEGGLEAWLRPDTPSGTPAVAAEMVPPASSASAGHSGSDTDTRLAQLRTAGGREILGGLGRTMFRFSYNSSHRYWITLMS